MPPKGSNTGKTHADRAKDTVALNEKVGKFFELMDSKKIKEPDQKELEAFFTSAERVVHLVQS